MLTVILIAINNLIGLTLVRYPVSLLLECRGVLWYKFLLRLLSGAWCSFQQFLQTVTSAPCQNNLVVLQIT